MSSVGVDFDGVIHAYGRGWHDGSIYDEPVLGAFDAIRQLMTEYSVFVFTCRDPDQVRRWIVRTSGVSCTLVCQGKFWNVRNQLLVTQRKYPAVAYIDDRGIRFENWTRALHDLEILTK